MCWSTRSIRQASNTPLLHGICVRSPRTRPHRSWRAAVRSAGSGEERDARIEAEDPAGGRQERGKSTEIVSRTAACVEHAFRFCAGDDPETLHFYRVEERDVRKEVEVPGTGRGIAGAVNVAEAGREILLRGFYRGGSWNQGHSGWVAEDVGLTMGWVLSHSHRGESVGGIHINHMPGCYWKNVRRNFSHLYLLLHGLQQKIVVRPSQ